MITQEAREAYLKSTDTYERGNVWNRNGGNYQSLENIIKSIDDAGKVAEELKKHDMYNITIRSQKKFDLMMQWNRRLLGVEVDPELIDTPNLYKMFFYCKTIKENCSNIETIVEVGGGNGQFARVAKKYLGIKTHIDIDLPESLYMAYVCTRHWHPEAKCLWVTDEKDINVSDYDFIFIPVQKEGILKGKSFDLFVNTASMGEMSNENMRHWMNFTQNEIKLKYFFGFNRFLNTVPANTDDNWHRIRKGENETQLLFDNRWDVIKWEVEPDFARCPYEDPRIARYLLFLAQRTEKPVEWEYDLSEIQEQDWWCYRDVGPLATHRDNQLVNDFTKGGTLYKLWDNLRLNPNKYVASMMLAYLKQLRREDIKFEEEFYYEKV